MSRPYYVSSWNDELGLWGRSFPSVYQKDAVDMAQHLTGKYRTRHLVINAQDRVMTAFDLDSNDNVIETDEWNGRVTRL